LLGLPKLVNGFIMKRTGIKCCLTNYLQNIFVSGGSSAFCGLTLPFDGFGRKEA